MPSDKQTHSSRTKESRQTNKSDTFPHRILVVDDDPSVLTLSALVLADHGYEVKTAVDGFDALAKLQKALPDVIISDLRMPNMSGFELLSVVRRRFPHIPAIAISGEYNGLMPVGVLADAFFAKGEYRQEELFARIAELLGAFAAATANRQARPGAGVVSAQHRRLLRVDLHGVPAVFLDQRRPSL